MVVMPVIWVAAARAETETANHAENKYRQIFRIREVHYLATLLLLYVGIAVTIGGMAPEPSAVVPAVQDSLSSSGWSVTYLIDVRGGGPNAGYISSGFFGGKYSAVLVCVIYNLVYSRRRFWPSCSAMGHSYGMI